MTSEEIISQLEALAQGEQASDKIDIVQQWQYIGHPDPRLMDDKAFSYCNIIGITSLQSYVTWSALEKSPEVWDFSEYDPLVDKIREHGLKWTPFLIAGPYYATPQWFQESPHSVYARCLEHGKDSRIQSIWNPHFMQHVERFLTAFAGHYDPSAISSVLLGISGNWGEAIYPDSGCFHGGFHTHPGYWCADTFALNAFRSLMIERYGDLESLNRAWSTHFTDARELSMPPILTGRGEKFKRFVIEKIPKSLFSTTRKAYWKLLSLLQRKSAGNHRKDICSIRRWLDFIGWYTNSMTKYADDWLAAARRHFPTTRLYLVNGGRGSPLSGADFSAQVKVAAGHGAGIRITNMTDHYEDSFIVTRLTVSAARHYKAFLGTEEAGVNSAKGVTMRIFDAASTNANEIYFKGLMGAGRCVCAQTDYPVGLPTEGALNFVRYRNLLKGKEPIRKIAILYPTTAIRLNQNVLKSLYLDAIALRRCVDFDFVDEQMITDGALGWVTALLLAETVIIPEKTLEAILKWIQSGGTLFRDKKSTYLSVLTSDNTIMDRPMASAHRRIVPYRSIEELISLLAELRVSKYITGNINKKSYSAAFDGTVLSYHDDFGTLVPLRID